MCSIDFLLIKHHLAEWSTCQLSDRAVCGNGVKTRMLDCLRSDGKSVDLKFCKEVRCVPLPIFKAFSNAFLMKHIVYETNIVL